MGLSEIAAGIKVTEKQAERGIATVDATDATLEQRLEPFADELPCSPAVAAVVLERYSQGGSIAAAGHAADIPPVTAAKTLHLLGESVSPLGPTGRDIVCDWISGELSRTEALSLTQAGETTFALATYVETHEPLEGACVAIEGVLATNCRPTDDALSDAVGEATDYL